MTIAEFIKSIFIVAVVVGLTDAVAFYRIKKNPDNLTIPFVVGVIIITLIPIIINFWVHFVVKN